MKNNLENFGVGIDIIDIERIRKKKIEKNKNLYNNMFFKSEIDYCLKFKDPYPHFAGKFAIKDSVIKSIDEDIGFLEILSNNTRNGPTVKLIHQKSKKYSFQVSVTHEKKYAVAVVISNKI